MNMRLNFLSKFVLLSMIFTLLLMSVELSLSSGKVAAAEVNKGNNYTEDDVEELATVLEVFFDKGIIYDENGIEKSYDRELLNKELSDTKYSDIISEFEDEGLLYDSDAEGNFTYEKLDLSNLPTLWAAQTPREKYVDQCIVSELNDAFGLGAVTVL